MATADVNPIPIIVANPVLWLDASAPSTLATDFAGTIGVVNDGDTVGRWKDRSGNYSDCMQNTGANKPVYKVDIQNGKSVLRFNGSSQYLNNIMSEFMTYKNSYTIFVVMKPSDTIANYTALGFHSQVADVQQTTTAINVTSSRGSLYGAGFRNTIYSNASVNGLINKFGDDLLESLCASTTTTQITFCCFKKSDNTLWSFGANNYGQLCNNCYYTEGPLLSTPNKISNDTWGSYSTGSSHFVGIKTDGTMWGCGSNSNGPLGQGSTIDNYYSLVQFGALNTWSKVYCTTNTFAIKTDGTLWACGPNISGALGVGDISVRRSLTQVGVATNWNYISSSVGNFTFGIQTDGTLWSWGFNAYGQLGQGDTTQRTSPVQVGVDTNWSSVAASGSRFTLALKTDGTLWACGRNGYGQLGLNVTSQLSFVQIGSDTDWASVVIANTLGTGSNSVFGSTGFLLKTNGTLWTAGGCGVDFCLGVEDTLTRYTPTQIGSDTDWVTLYGGNLLYGKKADGKIYQIGSVFFSPDATSYSQIGNSNEWKSVMLQNTISASFLAIKQDGTMWRWGDNYGSGGTGILRDPVIRLTQIGNDSNWNDCVSNANRAFGLKNDKTLWSWGNGGYGRRLLQSVDTGMVYTPEQVTALGTTWTQIWGGTGVLFLKKNDNSIWVSGSNSNGLMANGKGPIYNAGSSSYSTPGVESSSLSNVSDIQFPTASALMLKTDGTIWSWGLNTSSGILGQGYASTGRIAYPLQIGSGTTWSAISVSSIHCLALKSDGTLWAWGTNTNGQLGQGNTSNVYFSPTQVGVDTDWNKISAGSNFSYAIKTNGTLWSWGNNTNGQLGQGDLTQRTSPTQVGALTTWNKIFAQKAFSRMGAIKTDGTLWVCGDNSIGQLGLGSSTPVLTNITSFTQVGVDTNWSEIYPSNSASTYAKKTDNTMWMAGTDNAFLLTLKNPMLLQQVDNENWTMISSTSNETIGLKADGTLWAWGGNGVGQLGQNDTVARYAKTQIGIDTDWAYCIANNSSTYAIKTNGTLWACGLNSYGQLGLGNTSTGPRVLTQVGVDTNWSIVAAPFQTGSAAAIKTNGTLWTWGRNNYGQLGQGDLTQRTSPTQVGTDTNWTKIVGGWDGFAALKSDGTLWTWGRNNSNRVWFNSAITSVTRPTQPTVFNDWVELASNGASGFAAIRSNGTLWISSGNAIGFNLNSFYSSSVGYVQADYDTDWNKVYGTSGGYFLIKNDGSLWSMNTISNQPAGFGTTTFLGYSPKKINNGTYTSTNASCGGVCYLKRTSDNTTWTALPYNASNTFYASQNVNLTLFTQMGTDSDWNSMVSAGSRNVFLKNNGSVYVCGYFGVNTGAYLNSNNWFQPNQIGSDTDWSSIGIGGNNVLINSYFASKTDRSFYCGETSTSTSNGSGNPSGTSTFVNHPYINNCDQINSSTNSNTVTAFKTKNNSLFLSGILTNSFYGFETNRVIPQQVPGEWARTFIQSTSLMLVKSDGTIWGLGENFYSSLDYKPYQVTGFSNPIQVLANGNSTMIIKQDGTMWTAGSNLAAQGLGVPNVGKLGITNCYIFQRIPVSGSWVKITSSGTSTLAIKSDGTLWGTGNQSNNQLGTGSFSLPTLNVFVQVNPATNWSDVATGGNTPYSLGVKSDGTLWSWGNNSSGQLGQGNTSSIYFVPTQVGALTNWSKVYCSGARVNSSLAIKTDGTLWSSGNNVYGQLGQGDTTQRTSFTQVGVDTNWASASIGSNYSLAIKTDGTLWSCGRNSYGQLGLGDTTLRTSFTQVGVATNWSKCYAAFSSSYAIKTDGTLWACGLNTFGQVATSSVPGPLSFVQYGTDSDWESIGVEPNATSAAIGIKNNIARDVFYFGNNRSGRSGMFDPYVVSQHPSFTGSDWLLPLPSNTNSSVPDNISAAIKQDGTLWVLGKNGYGKFGTGTNQDIIPNLTQVGSESNYTDITYNWTSSIAIRYTADNNTAGSASSSFNYISVVYDGTQGTNASKLKTYINGDIQVSTYGSTVPASMLRSMGYEVGRTFGKSSNYFNGDIAEIIIYDTTLSDNIRQQIEAYLKAKWKL